MLLLKNVNKNLKISIFKKSIPCVTISSSLSKGVLNVKWLLSKNPLKKIPRPRRGGAATKGGFRFVSGAKN